MKFAAELNRKIFVTSGISGLIVCQSADYLGDALWQNKPFCHHFFRACYKAWCFVTECHHLCHHL